MTTDPESQETFASRHIGPRPADRDEMLKAIGAPTLDALIDQVIPSTIRLDRPLDLPPAESEFAFLQRLRRLAARNTPSRSFIGMGYYDCATPPVILRNVLENPGWYTPYTPYQAEVAQGRLEALLNFQTMVRDLTGMEVANASLLDESTAAAEAMTMLRRVQTKRGETANVFLVAETTWPQTIDVLQGRAEPLGIQVKVLPLSQFRFGEEVFGMFLQYPDGTGRVDPPVTLLAAAQRAGVLTAVATDLLALTLLIPPGELGADVVVGNAQRFGVPLGYGGPHAAFFATRDAYVRHMPGRIVGVSMDATGQPAYRMALQTREQHIRREKATSNICTAQALLAIMAGCYAVYHGPEGLAAIARRVHGHTRRLRQELVALGAVERNQWFFDTLRLTLPARDSQERLRHEAEAACLNFRYLPDGSVGVSLDETCTEEDVRLIVEKFALVLPGRPASGAGDPLGIPDDLRRRSSFLTHPVFHAHRSETQMMRYLKGLERRDIGLDTSMIPLGSCTMKLNAACEMMPLSWPEFSRVHPFVPVAQTQGYQMVFAELEDALRQVTGLAAVSLQPNSGAQGELAGLLVIRAWHRARGDHQRTVVLIPASAHGTNPASAVMAGMRVVVVGCDIRGNIDIVDLKTKVAVNRESLAGLMVTYPSTHGVFEDAIREICDEVHAAGGQVYMDGANMNAQVGLTSPARIGADVCHLNLHKTFAIPHGGGGPGMGPIAVAAHLAPYLPGHSTIATPDRGATAIKPVSGAPWGSASILLISYAYVRLLGASGMKAATEHAILNANYIKARLEHYFPVLYTRATGRVAHELIFDLRPFRASSGVEEIDVAKRLMDFGFHAPTVSFPVAGTLMVEPTESEAKDELDRFCDAMIAIHGEIVAIAEGRADRTDNPLKSAPHPAAVVTANTWNHAYSREQAAYPLPFVRSRKIWPAVARIDNAYGDRHLFCSCVPVEVPPPELVPSAEVPPIGRHTRSKALTDAPPALISAQSL